MHSFSSFRSACTLVVIVTCMVALMAGTVQQMSLFIDLHFMQEQLAQDGVGPTEFTAPHAISKTVGEQKLNIEPEKPLPPQLSAGMNVYDNPNAE